MKTHPPLSVCFEWAGYLVPGDVAPLSHSIVARTKHCVQRTLPVRTVVFWDIIIRWTRGGGGIIGAVRLLCENAPSVDVDSTSLSCPGVLQFYYYSFCCFGHFLTAAFSAILAVFGSPPPPPFFFIIFGHFGYS